MFILLLKIKIRIPNEIPFLQFYGYWFLLHRHLITTNHTLSFLNVQNIQSTKNSIKINTKNMALKVENGFQS